jgi:trans-aconitate methyltransferase
MSDNNPILAQYATSAPLATRRGLYDTNVGVSLTNRIDEQLKLSSAKSLLDIGCGYGTDVAIFHSRYPHLKIVGIDQSEIQIHEARERSPETQFFVADANNFNLNQTFDRILIRHVLHLVSDPANIIKRAVHHAHSGSRIVISMHSVKSQPTYKTWLTWFKHQTGIDYTFQADTFAFENQHHLFNQLTDSIQLHEVSNKIHLTSPEPYLDYIRSQTRWSRQPSADELDMLLEHVRLEIEKDIAQYGYFEDPSVNGIVTIDLN